MLLLLFSPGSRSLVGSAIFTTLAAALALEYHLTDLDPLVQRLAHIIDGQRSHTGGDQGLHLDSGCSSCNYAGSDRDAILAHLSSDINERQRQRVTHWDQL